MTNEHEAAPVRRWRPAPAIRLSMALHAAGALILVVAPGLWAWTVSALVANQLLLFAAVFWPRARVLGANLSRLPPATARHGEIVLTFDDGPDPLVTPQVLDLLDRYCMKASFFCIGEKAAAFPEIVREIARRGHGVENHSHRHSHAFAFCGLSRLAREVDAAQSAIAASAGRPPAFFRAPAGFRSPLLDLVLARRGLTYVSWTRRGYDTVRHDPVKVFDRLTRGLAAGDILLLHDGNAARTAQGEPVVLAVLPRLLEHLRAERLTSVALPHVAGALDPGTAKADLHRSGLS